MEVEKGKKGVEGGKEKGREREMKGGGEERGRERKRMGEGEREGKMKVGREKERGREGNKN